jgi:hypothetical protein
MNDEVEELYFYLFQDNATHGPLLADELRRLARNGTVGGDTVVCKAGEEDWSLVRDHSLACGIVEQAMAEYEHKQKLSGLLDSVWCVDIAKRDSHMERLSAIRVYYGVQSDRMGPTTLWQVLDLIDAEVLAIEIQVCVVGSDYWRDAVIVAAAVCGR